MNKIIQILFLFVVSEGCYCLSTTTKADQTTTPPPAPMTNPNPAATTTPTPAPTTTPTPAPTTTPTPAPMTTPTPAPTTTPTPAPTTTPTPAPTTTPTPAPTTTPTPAPTTTPTPAPTTTPTPAPTTPPSSPSSSTSTTTLPATERCGAVSDPRETQDFMALKERSKTLSKKLLKRKSHKVKKRKSKKAIEEGEQATRRAERQQQQDLPDNWKAVCPLTPTKVQPPAFFTYKNQYCETPMQFQQYSYPSVTCPKKCKYRRRLPWDRFYCVPTGLRIYNIPAYCAVGNKWKPIRYPLKTWRNCNCLYTRCIK